MITKIRKSILFRPLCLISAIVVLILTAGFSESGKATDKAGTPVTVQLNSTVNSNNCAQGQLVDFRVVYNVRAEGKTVIPSGTVAKGQVVFCQRAKGVGKPGQISIQIRNLTAPDGTMVPLSGSPIQFKGTDR